MDEKYFIGIDEGTQSVKIAVYDSKGNAVCKAAKPLRQIRLDHGGIAEHPGDDLWETICETARRLLSAFQGDRTKIVGVGLCTIRFCRCLLKKDGTLSQPVISWMDDRISRPYTHNNPDTSYVTTSSGYITHRLTGQFRDTVSNYLGAWPLDIVKRRWYDDEDSFRMSGLKKEMLFELVTPGSILGYVTERAAALTGIPQGLPVVATANDKAVEALGVGCIGEEQALLSLGTYIATMTPGRDKVLTSKNVWTNLACIPDHYLYESTGIRRGMWMLSWWASVIGGEYAAKAEKIGCSPEALLDREAALIPPGCDGLMVVPDWLAPYEHPYRKGMMLGFDGRHTRGHIYRSLMESIALTMCNNYNAMCREIDHRPETLIVSGGGANSPVFAQIISDVFNMTVYRAGKTGAAGIGAAICAAVATGVYPSFEEAVSAMACRGDVYMPIDRNVEIYNALNHEVYMDLIGLGDNTFKKTFTMFD